MPPETLNTDGIFQVEYLLEDWKPVIYLYRRVDKKLFIDKVMNFQPYFYVPNDAEMFFEDQRLNMSIVSVDNVAQESIFGEKLKKITVKKPSDVYRFREAISKTCEADVLYTIRYLIDNVQKIERKGDYRVCYFDIETTMIGGFPNVDDPQRNIISITLYDNYTEKQVVLVWREDFEKDKVVKGVKKESYINGGKEFKYEIYYFNDEKTMLASFCRLVGKIWDSDILVAWNIAFDIRYLLARMSYLNISAADLTRIKNNLPRVREIDAVLPGRVVFDLLGAYRRVHLSSLRSFALASVAADELGADKLPMVTTDKIWKDNVQELIKYNQRDVDLLVGIDQKIKLIDYFDEMRRVATLDNINSCLFYSRVIDTLILRKYKDRYVFPTKREYRKRRKGEEVFGGFVAEPEVGSYKNVTVFDFKALYPSLILTFNLSADTIVKEGGVKIQDTFFNVKKEGVLPSIIVDLIKLRKQYQDELKQYQPGTKEYETGWQKQFACKFLVNTTYGVNALTSFRLYDERVANAITYLGRTVVQWCSKIVRKKGYKVIYNDTDSLFIKMEDSFNTAEVIHEGKELLDIMNKELDNFVKQYGIEKHGLRLEFEKVYDEFLLIAKKRYAGHKVWLDGEDVDIYDYVGVDLVRSDVTEFAKEVQGKVLDMILKRHSKTDIFDYIRKKALTVKQMPFSKIAIPTKLEKDNYETNLPRVRAKDWSNKNLNTNYGAGSKFLMLYVNWRGTDVIGFDEDVQLDKLNGLRDKVKWDKILEVNVFDKMERTMEAKGWQKELLACKLSCINMINGQSSLHKYFN